MPSLVAIIIARSTERVKRGHWKYYENNETMSAFIKLDDELDISEDTIYKIDKLFVQCTTTHIISPSADLLWEILTKGWRTNNVMCKKIDGSILPPCSRVLLQKIQRTQVVTRRWLSPTQVTQSTIVISSRIWMERRKLYCYRLHWFDGKTSRVLSKLMTFVMKSITLGSHRE